MAQKDITHIEKVEIKNLWGKYDIDWKLNPNVNILIGINGSGKTTILNVMNEALDMTMEIP
jgi:predicted ATP-dependent endonuclease of OLD family